MLLREFDVEKYERSLREEGREEGKIEGREEGKKEGREAGLVEAGELIRRLFPQSNIKDLNLGDNDRKLLREMGI